MTETESRPRNRALVASFLFTDLVGYSKGTASDQYAAKEALSEILRRNLAALGKDDYRIKDTGDGCLIAFLVNPEHALYIALAIAHDFERAASVAGFPSNTVRTGLHIGAVKEAIDLEARPNFVGDGINAAKRIMDFAAPGQITASRAYFEAVSWLDAAYAALFQHLGASDDKHGRPHELYAVSPSDPVLEKLRLDLGGPAAETREAGKSAAPSEKPVGRSPSGVDASSAPGAKPGGTRRWLVAAAVIAGIAIVGAIGFAVAPQNRSGLASAPAESKVGAAESKPGIAAPPIALPAPSAGVTATAGADAKGVTSPAQAAPDANTPGPPAPSASDAKAAASASQPAAAKAASATRANPAGSGAETQRRVAEPPAAPAAAGAVSSASGATAVPSASSPASARCRHILEKVQIGEPLSQDEKKELASSCR